jgi:hypothetical protein
LKGIIKRMSSPTRLNLFLNCILPISTPASRLKTHLLKPSSPNSVHLNSSSRLPSIFFLPPSCSLERGVFSLRGKQVTGVALLQII